MAVDLLLLNGLVLTLDDQDQRFDPGGWLSGTGKSSPWDPVRPFNRLITPPGRWM